MHTLGGENLNLYTHSRFWKTGRGLFSVILQNVNWILTLSALGILYTIPQIATVKADGIGLHANPDRPHQDHFAGNVSFDNSFPFDSRLMMTVQNSNYDDVPGWNNLPKWQGLSDKHFNGGAVTDATINQVAKNIYDTAYTQLLIGDLDAAEEGFSRVINHYSQSTVARHARAALSEVLNRRNEINRERSSDHISFENFSSIHQLSIISLKGDFSGKNEKQPEKKDLGKLSTTGNLMGIKDDFLLNVGDRVFFAKRSAALTAEAKKQLSAQAEWLRAHKEFKLLIEGHADEEGPDHYNMALSANRALSVQRFFLTQKIDPGRIKTRHFGKSKPVAICKKEDCSMQNRRAVTKLLPNSAK